MDSLVNYNSNGSNFTDSMDSNFTDSKDSKLTDSKLNYLLFTMDDDVYIIQRKKVLDHIYLKIDDQFNQYTNRIHKHFWLRMFSKLMFFLKNQRRNRK